MDIVIKSVENVTEAEVMEWVAILVERKENAKLTPPKETVDASKAIIDAFRVANGLEAKFAAKEPV